MVNSPQSESAPSAKQLVFLAIMATVVAVIVFLCGVLVGRGVPVTRAPGAAASDLLAADHGQVAMSELGGPGEFDELDELGEPEPGTAGGDSSSALADLSYFERLNGTESVEESHTLRADETAASAPDDEVVADATSPASNEAIPEPPPVAVVEEEAAPATAPGLFVLQVTALRERDEANRVANDLVASGYPAFVVAPADDAPVAVFRVRVGPYEERAEAEEAQRRLEEEQRLRPWVIQL
ncbi:MAG: SPOR domain-containing protein [Acidobacteria bacterium]|nr:SPOR domain-containing protein [Acidobacteriota bacterium]